MDRGSRYNNNDNYREERLHAVDDDDENDTHHPGDNDAIIHLDQIYRDIFAEGIASGAIIEDDYGIIIHGDLESTTTNGMEDDPSGVPTDESSSSAVANNPTMSHVNSFVSAPTDEDESFRIHPQQQLRQIPKIASYPLPNPIPLQQSPPSPTTNHNTCNSTSRHCMPTGSIGNSGGPLWRLAGEIAQQRHPLLPKNNPASHFFAQSYSSRADVDVLPEEGGGIHGTPTDSSSSCSTEQQQQPHDVSIYMNHFHHHHHHNRSSCILHHHHHHHHQHRDDTDASEAEALLIDGTVARKRVRVAQLLIIGWCGILLGWLGNFFVASSCYFVSVDITVGGNSDNIFELHYGLWNYSPVDSALNGYKYCAPYPGRPRPVLARLTNAMALVSGSYSLVILSWYLISGIMKRKLWNLAILAAVLAGALQLATPLFFYLNMCQQHQQQQQSSSCTIGPAAVISIFTAVVWTILGAELYFQCPEKEEPPPPLSINLEKSFELPNLCITRLDQQFHITNNNTTKWSKKRYQPPEFPSSS
jgi:hypothetical protein